MSTIGSSTDIDMNSLKLSQSTQRKDPKTLGQEDFLSLMIEQMRNQDPLKPMENGEFIGQMAQFSTVSGIADMTKSVGALTDAFNSGQALQAASMVGRTVLSEGNTATAGGGRLLEGGVELPDATSGAVVHVYDAAGVLVRELPLGYQEAGVAEFSWDGKLANGNVAPTGRYSISAALKGDEESALTTFVASRVESVTLSGDGSGSTIRTDTGATLRLADVRTVK